MAVLAVVWHFWIAPVLVGSGVILVAFTVYGYFKKVTSQKYPPSGWEPEIPSSAEQASLEAGAEQTELQASSASEQGVAELTSSS